MKNKIWLFQIPLVALFACLFWVEQSGIRGELRNPFLRDSVFPTLRTLQGLITNLKFRTRGPREPKNKIVIVEIDNSAIEEFGRWPWHRDVTAKLIDKTFALGAKTVGLDMVFSEADPRVPDVIKTVLEANKLQALVENAETDLELQKTIQSHRDSLVLGWSGNPSCQPAYMSVEECPVMDPRAVEQHQPGFDKFAFEKIEGIESFDITRSVIQSAPLFLANIPTYSAAGRHAGFFNAWADKDGFIRRTSLVMAIKDKVYPSLALRMASIVKGDEASIAFEKDGRIKSIGFAHSKEEIATSPLGVMEINFRGPAKSFPYVSAYDILKDTPKTDVQMADRKLASVAIADVLKDAHVLIGLTALGVFDMRAFPFDENTAGVEGHANILDNILANDMLTRGFGTTGTLLMLILMTVGALAFAYATEKLESIPALLLAILAFGGFATADVKVLFANNINWNTSLLYIEFGMLFVFTLSVKYVIEERNKKFIKGAFAKYVSPAIIDSIMKDPSKLTVGGEKRDMTILFSDIRGFTTFSERMDAKALAGFLNDYLGIMTDIVFECEGTLDKYIGDAVMAFWGAPLDQPNHAANACKAAVKMMNALAQHRERFRTQYGVEVNIGIGINSGAVNVGNMGSERIFEYTVIGDHVNLASRLEGLTKYYASGIVTSRFTFEMIEQSGEPLPPHRTLDFVKVKGKKNAVELIQVIDKEMAPEGLRLFEEARGLYSKQEWDRAIELFRQASALLRSSPDEEDGPSAMYIERCREFKLSPPSADWDGSWEMLSK